MQDSDLSKGNIQQEFGDNGLIFGNTCLYGNYGVEFNGNGIIVERNTIAYSGVDKPSLTWPAGIYSSQAEPYSNCVVRYNTVYRCHRHGIDFLQSGTNTKTNFKIYNNTVYQSGDGLGFATTISGHIVNNIIFSKPRSSQVYKPNGVTSGQTLVSDYNTWAPESPLDASKYIRLAGVNYGTLSAWQAATPYDDNSLGVYPQFVDSAASNFRLAGSSPARDAGTTLTTATSAGSSSTSLVVADARFFTARFGVMGGDTLRIGSAAPVAITAVNYSTNTLTLAAARTWSSGAPVSLDYKGSAPDMGAWESEGTLQIFPEADAYTRAGSLKDNNYGTDTILAAKEEGGDNFLDRRSYLRFNLSGLSGTVASARLKLYRTSGNAITCTLRLVTNDTWNKNTLTFNNAPAAQTTNLATSSTAVQAFSDIDLTSTVEAQRTADGKISLLLFTTSSTYVGWASKENANAALRPYLEVTLGSGSRLGKVRNEAQAAQSTQPSDWDVYPNPAAQGTLYLKGPAEATEVVLLNLQGQAVAHTHIEAGQAWDLHHLPAGLYWVKTPHKLLRWVKE